MSTITRYTYLHKTKSNNTYPIELGYLPVTRSQIPVDFEFTRKACREGCKLYGKNGGCPPFAPDFRQLREKYPYGMVLYARLFTKDYPEKVLKGNYYVRWVLVESLLSHLMTRIGHSWKEKSGGYFLNTGHCIGCRKCQFKEGEQKCIKPQKRTFSLEATGIMVADLIKEHLDFELQWWRSDQPDHIPEYMTKVVLLLDSKPITTDSLVDILPGNSD